MPATSPLLYLRPLVLQLHGLVGLMSIFELLHAVNAVLVFPKSAEVKLPSLAGVVISR